MERRQPPTITRTGHVRAILSKALHGRVVKQVEGSIVKKTGALLTMGLVLLLVTPAGAQEMIFHGYVDFEARNKDHIRRTESSFDNHHFNLFLGSKLADNLIAQGEAEIEHGGQFKMEFAQIEWKPLYSDTLELVFGKFVVPFGIEHRVHASPRNKLITRPLPMRAIVPGTFSDAGINVTGVFPLANWATINYSAYTINGLGDKDRDGIFEQSNTLVGTEARDINDNKSLGFQLNLVPPGGIETRGIEVGASGLIGKWDVKDDRDYAMLGAHVIASFEPFEVRAEYVWLNVDKPGVAAKNDATVSGFYVQGSWQVHKFVELVARYDRVDNKDGLPALNEGPVPVTAGTGVKDSRITLGVLLRPQDWLAFKVEYFHRDNDSKSQNKNLDNGVGFQAVASW